MSLPNMVKMAGVAQPELMDKIANALKILEAYDKSFLPDVIQEMELLADVVHEKVAAFKDPADAGRIHMGGGVKDYLKVLGAAAVAAVGTAAASDMYETVRRGMSKAKNYKRIMEQNPELHKKDPKAVRTAFDALHRFAPEFSSDPLVGGAIVNNLAEFPQGATKTIYDVLGARKNLADARQRQYSPNPALGSHILPNMEQKREQKERSRAPGSKTPGHLEDNYT